jgi:hypothetical protein
VLGAARAIEDGKDLLTPLVVIISPIDARSDQLVGRNVHYVALADEIGFKSNKPIVLTREYRCQRAACAQNVDIPCAAVERVATHQRFRRLPVVDTANERHGDAPSAFVQSPHRRM